ncbi:MAG: sigma-70 family RNA polymerase sigma factor [Verrucomicrobia bacterium]|nr:sigma-70 family RNA polymerase sigma factor [Verrucomicrobiota bacterium]
MSAETESSLATRPSLLARLKDWSQQTAWREFDHDYAPLLRNVARKAGLSDAEADEVAQETLIAVAKRIAEFQHAGNRGSFRAWLYQQARWRIADQFRARAKASPQPQRPSHPKGESGRSPGESEHENEADLSLPCSSAVIETPMPESDPVFEQLWDVEWEQQLLRTALEHVRAKASLKQFQMFDLHVLQGLSVRETARTLGVNIASVYMAKSRVGRQLRHEIRRLEKVSE